MKRTLKEFHHVVWNMWNSQCNPSYSVTYPCNLGYIVKREGVQIKSYYSFPINLTWNKGDKIWSSIQTCSIAPKWPKQLLSELTSLLKVRWTHTLQGLICSPVAHKRHNKWATTADQQKAEQVPCCKNIYTSKQAWKTVYLRQSSYSVDMDLNINEHFFLNQFCSSKIPCKINSKLAKANNRASTISNLLDTRFSIPNEVPSWYVL